MKLTQFIRRIILMESIYYYEYQHENSLNNECHIRKMDMQDLEYIKNNYTNEITKKKLELLQLRIIMSSQTIFSILYQEKIAGYCCISKENTYESGLRNFIKVDSEEVYFFDDYIFKNFRNKKLHKESILARINICHNNGYNRYKACIYNWNSKSIHNYSTCGFQLYYKLLAIRPFHIVIPIKSKYRKDQE